MGKGSKGRRRSPDTRWAKFTERFARCIGSLGAGDFITLTAPTGRFAQVVVQDGAIRVETVSNQYLGSEAIMPYEEFDALTDLGWHPPTHFADEDAEHDQGSPNYWVDLASDIDLVAIAELLIATLREIHDAEEPEDLTYRSFNANGERIRLKTLHLSRTPS